ncbi:ABC transporter substrate-binding protein [Halarcobacter sp.]|uniref:ABC transporter substrate-binding protein n=1 Tax=Halarcobacter sp. TaxID=2321133 RepID=UPI0029F527D6|nr:ABC transporter substrate-binding protein [Halarcobacter sp.]
MNIKNINNFTYLVLSLLIINYSFIFPSFAKEIKPIIIAHVSPSTGRFSIHSEADWRGAQMAVDEFNNSGGVLGRSIILVQQNPTLDTEKAAKVAEDLITINKISFMLGAVNSGVATSMSDVCQKYGVIFINTNSSAPSQSVEHAHRTKFVFDANAANYNKTLLKFALEKSKRKKVILLSEDNNWGKK